MNILVIGAGAIGCLVGGKLAHSGQQVMFGSRPRFVEAVQAHGLTLVDETGRHVIDAAAAAPSIGAAFAATNRPFDLAILTVKSFDTAAAVQEVVDGARATNLPVPPMLSLQNGVGNEDVMAASLPAPVLAGVITTPVSVPAPAVIQVDRPSYTLGLSVWPPVRPPVGPSGAGGDRAQHGAQQGSGADGATVIEQTAEALRTAGFRVRLYPHAAGLKWTKLLMNMMGNALSAILDEPPARLFLDARLADLEIRAWREALQVMDRAQIPPVNLGSYRFAWLAPLIRYAPKAWLRPILGAQVGKARGGKMPSLHMDLQQAAEGTRRAGVRSEVEWLNGAVVRMGQTLHVPTPVNQLLTTTLEHLFQEPQARAAYRHQPERLLAELRKLESSQGSAQRIV